MKILSIAPLMFFFFISCSQDNASDTNGRVLAPEVSKGLGTAYPLQRISFNASDNVLVSALFGKPESLEPQPVILLLHTLQSTKEEWLSETDLFVELLARGYAVVAIDLRGQGGQTPLPEAREVLTAVDVQNSFRDVQAAINWLRGESAIDSDRIALIGNGSGGNVAYVSSGVFPEQIRTTVSLSPGLWQASTLEPLVVGDGLSSFGRARSMLFLVGESDQLPVSDGVALKYADFARNLMAVTETPKDLKIFDSAAHGFDLLIEVPEAKEIIFQWLEKNL